MTENDYNESFTILTLVFKNTIYTELHSNRVYFSCVCVCLPFRIHLHQSVNVIPHRLLTSAYVRVYTIFLFFHSTKHFPFFSLSFWLVICSMHIIRLRKTFIGTSLNSSKAILSSSEEDDTEGSPPPPQPLFYELQFYTARMTYCGLTAQVMPLQHTSHLKLPLPSFFSFPPEK